MKTILTEPDTRFVGIAKPHNAYGKDWDGSIPVGAEMHPRGTGSHLIATTRNDDGSTNHRYVLHPFKGTFHRVRPHPSSGTEYENLGWIQQLKGKLLEINSKCRECGKRDATDLHHTVARAHDLELVLYNTNYMTMVCKKCHGKLEAKHGHTSRGKSFGLRRNTAYMSGMCHFLASLYASNDRIASVLGVDVTLVKHLLTFRTSTGVYKNRWVEVGCPIAKTRPPSAVDRRPKTKHKLMVIEAHRLEKSGLDKNIICEKMFGESNHFNKKRLHTMLYCYDDNGKYTYIRPSRRAK